MRVFIAFILVFNNLAASTQDMGFTIFSKPDPDQDSAYLRNYGNYFVPSFYNIIHFSNFSIYDERNKTKLIYEPNTTLGVGLCASYKWMGIAGSVALGFLNSNKDDHIYGETKKIDLYTNLYSKKFLYDLNFQHYRGYFLKNVDKIDSTWKPTQAYPYRPDINTVTIGFAVYYIVNYTHFSLKAPYNYCDEQLHSAGSWILGGYFSGYGLWSETGMPIVLPEVPFQDSARFSTLHSIDIGVSGGYAYTWVFKKHWFISGMLLPGLSIKSFGGTNVYGNLQYDPRLAWKMQSRISIGYSRPRLYFGIVVVSDAFSLNKKLPYEFEYKSGYVCLSVGTRILPNKHRKRVVRGLE